MLILLLRKEKINWHSKLMTLSQTAEFIFMLSSTCQIMSLNFIKRSWSHRTQFLFQFSDSTNGLTSSFLIENLEMSSDMCLIESTLKDSWVISLIDLLYFWRETSSETLILMKKWSKLDSSSSRWKKRLWTMHSFQIIVLQLSKIMLRWCNQLQDMMSIYIQEECH